MVAAIEPADRVDETSEPRERFDSIDAPFSSPEPAAGGLVAVPANELPTLTDEIVRATLEKLRP